MIKREQAIRKQWVFDPICNEPETPKEILEEVRRMWMDLELGNDYCMFKFSFVEDAEDYPLLAEWLLSKGIPSGEIVWIHWWW